MSRIGKKPIALPKGVDIKVNGSTVTVKGPKGTLSQAIHADLSVEVNSEEILIGRPNDSRTNKAQHGRDTNMATFFGIT